MIFPFCHMKHANGITAAAILSKVLNDDNYNNINNNNGDEKPVSCLLYDVNYFFVLV